MIRRVQGLAVVIVAVIVAAVALSATAAAAASSSRGRIGPNQIFVGLVNGSTGIRNHAQIRVVCPGPIKPGETTHPLPNQTLEVTPPASVDATVGNTGASATQISVFMGIPPSAATATGIATFTHYGVTKPIPTRLTVPCSGSGYMTFMPLPRDPGTSRSFVVPVDYVDIAV